MADFFDNIADGVVSAESTFGESYTLNTSLTVFKGIIEQELPIYSEDLGDFDESIDCVIISSLAQFTTAGLTPEAGDYITYNSEEYRVLRVNKDKASYEIVLRLKP
jgi:hypothetical protein